MKILSRENFSRAREYLETQARPLDWALFKYHFEGVPAAEVLEQLSVFQNPDGGFGNALEPDVRTPTSSGLATEIGLRKLVEMGIPSEHRMVRAAVAFLLDNFDSHTMTWRVIPEDANDYSHASWWHDEAGSLARTFDDFLVIPRAGLVACLLHYHDLVPGGWMEEVINATIQDIQEMDEAAFGGGGDAIVYIRRLAAAPHMPESTVDFLTNKVKKLADRFVTREPESWSGYCAPPVKLAPSPESITAEVLADCLPTHLDFLIEKQSPEGCWEPTWAWNYYPEDWEVAKKEWRGDLTLDTLVSLNIYGRIEVY
jgi:hypothetical protein